MSTRILRCFPPQPLLPCNRLSLSLCSFVCRNVFFEKALKEQSDCTRYCLVSNFSTLVLRLVEVFEMVFAFIFSSSTTFTNRIFFASFSHTLAFQKYGLGYKYSAGVVPTEAGTQDSQTIFPGKSWRYYYLRQFEILSDLEYCAPSHPSTECILPKSMDPVSHMMERMVCSVTYAPSLSLSAITVTIHMTEAIHHRKKKPIQYQQRKLERCRIATKQHASSTTMTILINSPNKLSARASSQCFPAMGGCLLLF